MQQGVDMGQYQVTAGQWTHQSDLIQRCQNIVSHMSQGWVV